MGAEKEFKQNLGNRKDSTAKIWKKQRDRERERKQMTLNINLLAQNHFFYFSTPCI